MLIKPESGVGDHHVKMPADSMDSSSNSICKRGKATVNHN